METGPFVKWKRSKGLPGQCREAQGDPNASCGEEPRARSEGAGSRSPYRKGRRASAALLTQSLPVPSTTRFSRTRSGFWPFLRKNGV